MTTLTSSDLPSLDAKFAEIVAGWKRDTRPEYSGHWVPPGERQLTGLGAGYYTGKPPRFTQDANAVLGHLEKMNQCSAVNKLTLGYWGWTVTVCAPPPTSFVGQAPTFAHAAVLALLRSHGATVSDE